MLNLLPPLLLLSLTTASPIPIPVPAPHHHHPTPRLEDIQCRCLPLSPSPQGQPTLCSPLALHPLDWPTAHAFALDNNLAIQLASQHSMAQILGIAKTPLLLDGVLDSVVVVGDGGGAGAGAVKRPHYRPVQPSPPPPPTVQLVCGLGDEVDHLDPRVPFSQPELHYIGLVLAALMLFLIVWALVEAAWRRYWRQGGDIKLEGEEKRLMAAVGVVEGMATGAAAAAADEDGIRDGDASLPGPAGEDNRIPGSTCFLRG